MNKKNFCVPAKFNAKFLEEIDKKNRSDYIYEVYGALPSSFIGHGRPANKIINNINFEDFLLRLKKLNIKFNYLLNAPCAGNLEYTTKWQNDFLKFIERLIDLGITDFTVTIPFLVEFLLKHYPYLNISGSVISRINNIRALKFWESLGLKRVNLDNMINRRFNLIDNLLDVSNIDFELMINESCLLECPYRNYHYNVNAHASQSYETLKPIESSNYPMFKCSLEILDNLSEYVKAPWIRPEDLIYYEKKRINFYKIVGRLRSTDYIFRCLDSYIEKRKEQNLFDIIPTNFPIYELSRYLKKPPKECQLPLTFENFRLNSFLEFFLNNNCSLDCSKCNYCVNIAKDVIKITDKERFGFLKEKLRELLDITLKRHGS